MRKEQYLPVHPILPLNSHYTVKSHHSCYLSIGIVRPMADIKQRFSCCNDLPELSAAAIADERKVIGQGQLDNISKYSRATQNSAGLLVQEVMMQVAVKDNGIGFDAKSERSGIGLSNIYDRVASCKGTMELHTSKGQGCAFSVALQVHQIQSRNPLIHGKDHHPHC